MRNRLGISRCCCVEDEPPPSTCPVGNFSDDFEDSVIHPRWSPINGFDEDGGTLRAINGSGAARICSTLDPLATITSVKWESQVIYPSPLRSGTTQLSIGPAILVRNFFSTNVAAWTISRPPPASALFGEVTLTDPPTFEDLSITIAGTFSAGTHNYTFTFDWDGTTHAEVVSLPFSFVYANSAFRPGLGYSIAFLSPSEIFTARYEHATITYA